MNAGGVPNTCKSNEELCIRTKFPSGERVSNALVTCPKAGDNSGKLELIPHVVMQIRCCMSKGVASLKRIHFGRDLRPIS